MIFTYYTTRMQNEEYSKGLQREGLLADGTKAPAVFGAGAESGEGFEVGRGRVALVLGEAVAGVERLEPPAVRVSGGLREDGGGGDEEGLPEFAS